jgi:hypothetical protein
MRITDVKKLGKGDQVYWNDPAGPEGCSRIYNINTITVYPGGVVHICDDLGEVECYARELLPGLPDKRPTLWDNNEIQFARLLCELVANCDDLKLLEVAESMDLDMIDIRQLFDRAHDVWEASKAKHCPPPEQAENTRKTKLAKRIEAEAKAGNPLFVSSNGRR